MALFRKLLYLCHDDYFSFPPKQAGKSCLGEFLLSYTKIQKNHNTGNQIVRFVWANLRQSLFISSSCSTGSQYDFESSDDALKEYSSFFHSIQEKSSVNSEQMAALINQWRELSDTDYDNSKS